MLNEADTCTRLIVPKLREGGWDAGVHSFNEQQLVPFTDGRIVMAGSRIRRKPPKRADYLLRYTRDLTIAVVEAKSEDRGAGDGLQQAKDYAEINMDGGIAVLSLGAVTGFAYRPDQFKRTSGTIQNNAHYWLALGDLLITRSNTPELVGHAAIYNGRPHPCIYPDLMMKLVVDPNKADARFIHLWLRGPVARDYIRANAKGTSSTMKKISQGIVMGIPFPRLGLTEQRRIVAYLDSLSAKVESLKSLQHQSAAELDALLPSILERAFNGQL